ncbi:sensor histidine kinase [Clostridium frigidicarnis]|uniref:histidine kinase n=1 Tax=Clostridium frigidicarnis TaxID=84698 RepID=A0A1I0X3X3_9CLOT|nr:HAMP domain-containing sensor histidine kinase [Clostridium frigidicarnis]SFA95695.1 Signal transduction histidine kinase [Clostridium frigidicarnis]
MNKLFVNSEVKKSTLILTSLLTIFIIIQGLLYVVYTNNQKQDYIDIVGSMVSKTITLNPELEKELIPLITQNISNKDKEAGNIILKEYGIASTLNNNLFPNLRNNYGIFIVSVVLASLLLILNYIQYNYFFKKVRNISLAANKILDDDYSALINEDKEGDFSKLAVAFSNVRSIIRNNISTTQKEKQYLVELLQNISHQLKTKLATIMLYNDILLNRKLTEEQRVQFLEDNRIQLDNMNMMIQNILKLARLDANAIEFYKKEDNLNKTIEEVVYTFKDFADNANIELSLNNDEHISFLHDKFWIQEAFSNIIKNSIEHTPKNGKVKIYLYDNPAYSRVIIQDTGKGIELEEVANIFKRFNKNKSPNKKDSVGIGLAISKSIIESHNGYIDVKSTKGEGTSFFITFMKY